VNVIDLSLGCSSTGGGARANVESVENGSIGLALASDRLRRLSLSKLLEEPSA
jgi:hypothetical protein